MEILNKNEEFQVTLLIAKEFLEMRLGIEATNDHILKLAEYIVLFEEYVKQKSKKL